MDKISVLDKKHFVMDKIILSRTNLILSRTKNILYGQMDRAKKIPNFQGQYWKEQRRFLLRNLRDFGFGKSSMEDSLQMEVEKLANFLSTKVNQPFDLNRTTNISIVNALWGILVGERLELTDPKLHRILAAFDSLLRGNAGKITTLNIEHC